MGFSKSLISLMVVFAVICSFMVEETKAQEADCASKLVPCAAYLGSSKPPASCCIPLRETVIKQRDCLCKLYDNPSFFKSLNINITEALELPKRCGISAGISACNAPSPAPEASLTSPASTLTPPASTLTPPPAGIPGSDANKMALTGVSTILLFCAFVMAY